MEIHNFANIKDVEAMLEKDGNLEKFSTLMVHYECAMLEVKTKLDVLNTELSLHSDHNPFESIKSRLKKPISIYEKLNRLGLEFTPENIEENLNDVAGIRVICSFPDDIYKLAECIEKQDDIEIIQRKDYIANPKPNGYRSLHLIVQVPIFLMQEKKNMRVELQFRTIAMDFWATLEHKMKYKKDIKNPASIQDELFYCAELISQLDGRMQQIRSKIEKEDEVVKENYLFE